MEELKLDSVSELGRIRFKVSMREIVLLVI